MKAENASEEGGNTFEEEDVFDKVDEEAMSEFNIAACKEMEENTAEGEKEEEEEEEEEQ